MKCGGTLKAAVSLNEVKRAVCLRNDVENEMNGGLHE